MDPLAREIHEQVARYLTGKMNLRRFREWLAPVSIALEEDASGSSVEAIFGIELALSELDAGHRTEPEFRRRLLPLVQNYTFRLGVPAAEPVFSGSGTMVRRLALGRPDLGEAPAPVGASASEPRGLRIGPPNTVRFSGGEVVVR